MGVSLTLLFGLAALGSLAPHREANRTTAQEAAKTQIAGSQARASGPGHPLESPLRLELLAEQALEPVLNEARRHSFAGESKERILSRASVAPFPLDALAH